MGKAEESKAAFDAAQTAHSNNPAARIGRMILCVLTMGFAFPNAFIESVDIDDYEARSNTRKE